MTTYTLDTACREYLIMKGEDTLHEYKRALQSAIRTLKDLHYDVSAVPKVEVLDVETGHKVTLPEDVIRVMRIGFVSEAGRYIEIFTDKGLVVNAQGTYDATNNTNVVEAHSSGMLNFSLSDISGMFRNGQVIGGMYGNVGGGVYSHRVDWERGLIEFSSNVSGQVVLEYLGDPDKINGEYRYHPFLNDPIQDGIHYYMIKAKRSYSPGEKADAHRVYLNSKHHAKIRFMSKSVGELFNISRKTINQSIKF